MKRARVSQNSIVISIGNAIEAARGMQAGIATIADTATDTAKDTATVIAKDTATVIA